MIRCPICKKAYDETKKDAYNKFAEHVSQCCKNESDKRKAEDIEKINEQLEELKRLKTTYEAMRDDFKEKYPDIYAANFEDSKKCTGDKCNCKKNNVDINNKNNVNEETDVYIDDFFGTLNDLFGVRFKRF